MSAYLHQASFYASSRDGGYGSIVIKTDGSSHTYELDERAIDDLKRMADGLIGRRREAALEEIRRLEIMPSLTYEDKSGAIDVEPIPPIPDDDIPF